MKFLAVFILSLSLLVSSSFAVSLTPPLVLKMQEDRSTATDIDTTAKKHPIRDILITSIAVPLVFSGLLMTLISSVQIGNDDYNQFDAKLGIGVGTGMAVLGAGGLIFISYF
ncbi:hypothetical protein [Fibrobacter sp. UBA3718]|uniref:hypothetical protein n=1 Tax=Fibrobacter sp. UBA3718 TaxID=1946531 RepID=UPI0025C0AFF4|nr:hypothetical protein [Fibrobacter sp. UBA3718]